MTTEEILALISSLLPDNLNQEISAEDLREVLEAIVNNLGSTQITNVTHDELLALVDAGELVLGSYYRLTDFKTITKVMGEFVNTDDYIEGTLEPLILKASGTDSLFSAALSELFPLDVILYNISDNTPLSAPIIDDVHISKGVITYRMNPELGIETYYDWRNVKYRRWQMAATGLGAVWYLHYSNGWAGMSTFQHQDYLSIGTGCKNIHIGPNSFNIVIKDDSYDIEIAAGVGMELSGVTIEFGCHSVIILHDSCQVATAGTYVVGGIYIMHGCYNIHIGQRSYNIAIGPQCYGLHLGTQQSDVYVPELTYRRRIEKGYSNFEVTLDHITGNTIDLYGTTIYVIEPILFNTANHCGIVNLELPTEDLVYIDRINAHNNSVVFHPIEVRLKGSSVVCFRDTNLNTSSGKNIALSNNKLYLNYFDGHQVTFGKRLIDGLGSQTSNWYLHYTNKSFHHPHFRSKAMEAPGCLYLGVDPSEPVYQYHEIIAGPPTGDHTYDMDIFIPDGYTGISILEVHSFWKHASTLVCTSTDATQFSINEENLQITILGGFAGKQFYYTIKFYYI